MKRFLVLALAALGVTAFAAGAWADSDCCFDLNFVVNGEVQCFQHATQANCFARGGVGQIYAPQFDCVNNGDTSCKRKTGAVCHLTSGGLIWGDCSRSDLVYDQPVPGMSTMTLGILLLLLASAATWMLARRRTGTSLA